MKRFNLFYRSINPVCFLVLLLFPFVTFAQPHIDSFSPNAGAAGSVVTITGSNFDPAPSGNAVYFGGLRSTVVSANSTSLQVTVPSGASSATITITTNNLTARSASAFDYLFPGGGIITVSSFKTHPEIATGASPYAVASADLDDDGKNDLIVVNGGYPYSLGTYRNTSVNGNASFDPAINLATGVVPFGIATGDVDGDGKIDIIATNSGVGSYSVSVFINTSIPGSVSFAAGIQYATGANPNSVALDDLDGDGKPEIVTANFAASTFSYFKNNSSGGVVSFDPKVDIATGAYPNCIKIKDIDGDGKMDIAVSNNSASTVSLFRNTSTTGIISFAPRLDMATGGSPQAIEISDIDGNGKPELLVVSATNSILSVYPNQSNAGAFAFGTRLDFPVAVSPVAIAVNDIDGDGKADIVIASNANDSVTILHHTGPAGNIAFSAAVFLPVGGNPHGISVADISLDGKPDIITANQLSNTLSVYINHTDGINITSFSPASAGRGDTIIIRGNNFTGVTAVGFGGTSAAVFSVVSDTLIRAVVDTGSTGAIQITSSSNTASINGFSYYNLTVIYSFSPLSASAGTKMTIKGNHLNGANAVLFGGIAALNFTVVSDTLLTAIVGNGSTGIVSITTPSATSNLPGFNFTDVIPAISSFAPVAGTVGSTVIIHGKNFSNIPANNIVYFGSVRANVMAATSTTITAIVPAGASFEPLSVSTGNLVAYSAEPFHVSFGAGGIFSAASFTGPLNVSAIFPPMMLRSADLDGDGKQDLMEINYQGNTLHVFRNTTTGVTASFGPRMDFHTGTTPMAVATGDLDGDGLLDLAVVNLADNTLSVFRNTSTPGNISFAAKIDFPTAEVPKSISIADVDGDGRPDLVIANSYSYTSTISVLRNTGSAGNISFSDKVDFAAGSGPVSVVLRDLDGDGKPDAVTANFNGSSVSVLRNTSIPGLIAFNAKKDFAVGVNPQTVTIGDLDGDGKPDIGTINLSSQTISVLRNLGTQGNISFETKLDIATGGYGKDLTFGDLDGDGKPDILFTAGADSVLLCRNISSIGTIQLSLPKSFKTPGNIDCVWISDWNGDGKNDIGGGSSTAISIFNNNGDVAPKPVIKNFTPVSGAQGDTIYINGFNFTGGQTVSFGGIAAASFQVVDDSIIRAIVGQGATGAISVVTGGGIDSLGGFTYTGPSNPIPQLHLNSFSPDSASTDSIVFIKGKNLSGSTSVFFGNTPAKAFVVMSDSLLKATVGTGASGVVLVTGPSGTDSLPGFKFFIPVSKSPVIYSFTPTAGWTGTVITILGTHFTGTTYVSIGGYIATSYTMLNDSVITAVLNSGSTGAVVVTTPYGTAQLDGFNFSHTDTLPAISSFSPRSAPQGTTVNIHGSGFALLSQISFGGTTAQSWLLLNDSTCTAVVGEGSSGNIQLITAAGAASIGGFIYENPADSAFVFNSFTANFSGTAVRLDWSVSHQAWINYYMAEWSADSIHFERLDSVAVVPANGVQSYSFSDTHVHAGNNYYRISATDTNGIIITTKIILVAKPATTEKLRVYPNPAHSFLQVTYPLSDKPSKLKLVDMKGNLVKTFAMQAGSTGMTILLTGVDPGIYSISWSDGTKSSGSKVIIK